MNIIELKERPVISGNTKLHKIYLQFGELLKELNKKELSQSSVKTINNEVEELNASLLTEDKLRKLVKQKQTKILKQVEKEFKIVPKNYYRTLWLAVGMSAFGVPIGVVFGLSVGNMGLLGVGLPIGMVIGMAVGAKLDQNALGAGKQLNLEIKY
ncbi:hypothetical protein [Flavobacterium sp. Arc2]|uniref:hypothetical protein n=1 Tax=Flavobacterium sp. Arc2 TaxID=3046685 RepID=UPI00352D51D3